MEVYQVSVCEVPCAWFVTHFEALKYQYRQLEQGFKLGDVTISLVRIKVS